MTSPTIDIKAVGAGDKALFERIADDVFDHAPTDTRLAAYFATPAHAMWVGLDGDLVVAQGRSIRLHHPDMAPELFIENLGVAPAYRRRGIATRLMREMFRWGAEQGCETMWVGTESVNDGALAFYRTLGLREEPMVLFDAKLEALVGEAGSE